MAYWVLAAGWVAFTCLGAGALGFVLTSVCEQRWRAVHASILLFTPILGVLASLLLVDYAARTGVVLTLFALAFLTALLLTLRHGATPRLRILGPQNRIDEREAIFHRFYRLEPGMPEFEEYYREHPEHREFDDEIRALPEWCRPGSANYDELVTPFSTATFDVIGKAMREIDWPPEPPAGGPVEASPNEFTRRIKGFAKYVGGDLVGVAKLNPAYVYSHVGRSPGKWGAPIELHHEYAIAIAVEMSHDMIRHAPGNAVLTETAFKYFEVGKIALLTSRYINTLGYESRAHVDGNYRVLCGPIAVDAGLGELGRLGLLITPEYGPRVRLSIVTTNIPLKVDKPIAFGVQHFCQLCKKCATNCPSGAVDDGAKRVSDGVEKWRSSQEKCFRFWRLCGTDCSMCVNVCPYSHPNTPLHNLVRWCIRRNPVARRLALLGDDFFYSRRPRNAASPPDWHTRG